MPPPQALGDQDLVDATPLDRDALVLVEVGLQAVERPGAEGQSQLLRVGQGCGEDRRPLLGGIGRRAPGPPTILQAGEPPLVEAVDPGVDGGAREAQVPGDLAGSSPVGDGQEDPSPLDVAGLGRP
jgi:hypothetical protein